MTMEKDRKKNVTARRPSVLTRGPRAARDLAGLPRSRGVDPPSPGAYDGGVAPDTMPAVHLAFRFHVSFVHSYRGDTVDELGFGKDIRVIRGIVRTLDEANARGIPVRGAWDIENHYSLATVMPRHCPDLVEAIRRRVRENGDEVEPMSWNNGLVAASTADEFDAAISRAFSHTDGAGLRDLFGTAAPVVRPQEMMYTPAHLALYPRHGVEAISLYYSALPFNAFSTFIPPLPLEQRHNPLRLVHPDVPGAMILLPAVNNGDVGDNLSLRAWLVRLRRHQRSMREPRDLLLLLDMDADDEFWAGYGWPVASRLLAAAGGLGRLIGSVAGLPFLRFTTPGKYLADHEPVGTITIRQDTADGSFDGYGSWAEKWTNQALWTGIERSRVLELQARRLLEEPAGADGASAAAAEAAGEARALLARGFERRLLAFCTTYFGLASPLVNVGRLAAGANLVGSAVADASRALELARDRWLAARSPPRSPERPQRGRMDGERIAFEVIDYRRGVPTEAVPYPMRPSRTVVTVPLAVDAGTAAGLMAGCRLERDDGSTVPCAVRESFDRSGGYELLFVERNAGGERHGYKLVLGTPGGDGGFEPVTVEASKLATRDVAFLFDGSGAPVGLRGPGCELEGDPFVAAAVTWSGRTRAAGPWRTTGAGASPRGDFGWRRTSASVALPLGTVEVEREYLVAAGLPYALVGTRVRYPATPAAAFPKGRSRRLGRTWDARWQEVMPCEIRPGLAETSAPYRVWKRNWLDSVTSYDLDYGSFSRNDTIDSGNNHLTAGWVAFSDRRQGLLVGQESVRWSSFAFCPVRIRRSNRGRSLTLNPFGSYRGRQLSYPTRVTGLGRAMALLMADQLAPLAPDYAGRSQDFRLLLAPYRGDRPPEDAAHDAEAFAYPHLIVSRSPLVASAAWHRWELAPHDPRYDLLY